MTIRVHTTEGVHVYERGHHIEDGGKAGLVCLLTSNNELLAAYPAGSFTRINRAEPQIEKVEGKGDYEAGYAAHVAWVKAKEIKRQEGLSKLARGLHDAELEQG